MPYVGAGAPLHEQYVQRLPLHELWWRLLEPYKQPECPTHVMVTAAELPSFNATSGSFSDMKGNQTSRMGVYERTEHLEHFRPVYRQKMNANDEFIESGEYLYYMTDLSKDNWVIGPEPGGILRGIQSSGSSGAHCPNMAMGWVGATGGKENGGWSPPGGVSVAPKYCGFEGPKLVWEPVIRACGDSSQTALLVSSITECAMRMGDEVDSIAGLGPSGTFWVDGAERASTHWNFAYEPRAAVGLKDPDMLEQKDTLQPSGHSGTRMGQLDLETANDMAKSARCKILCLAFPGCTRRVAWVENAEAQLRSYRTCRDNPQYIAGMPHTQELRGYGFTAPDEVSSMGVPRCAEIQQMRGRCGVTDFENSAPSS
ncbi:hypothetical protein EMIHUDRAFT_453822 [Emiliania huxleyi CCMP1516]|uniref:Uncharacterized protein n=2 Tax=Emiliania huxleyi TaxID=2903 RepID=A0A0D3I0G9_EMIH1|nr:hypothetical protein EMIHUDRAFT_453822 [Emiliania huxleyi CCMP1516]EOD04754.1 hypothetical protein EMIHUDRAFT_453822 [Emiliania huxleyi CCMP1516]|eukprot:XP_005757183.1 hypothetical protein EMIHUDRAFT_453822 [Emiliania huxleyi CCMP1516]